jgi:hypothetical protein
MDGKRPESRSVDIERTFSYCKEHDVSVEAPGARGDLVAGEPGQITPGLVPSPEGLPDNDGDDPIDEGYPRSTAVPRKCLCRPASRNQSSNQMANRMAPASQSSGQQFQTQPSNQMASRRLLLRNSSH